MNLTVKLYIPQKTHEFGNAASHSIRAGQESFGLGDPVCSLLANWIVGKREIHCGQGPTQGKGTDRIGVISLPEVGQPRPVNPAKQLVFVFLASAHRLLQGKTPFAPPFALRDRKSTRL